MRFQCPCCSGVVAVDEEDSGQAVACGHCGSAVAVPNSRLTAGSVIGDCVIRKELGEGGMGRVFLAHQLSLDRDAALKVLHAQFSQDESYINDFIREARAAAKLNHPNIVQAYAVGEDEGIYYFAMEYVEGSTLKQVLVHGGRIVIDRALGITEEIAKALDVAWKNQKLVHRDIKPDNIILTGSGEVKLADLGLAHIVTDMRAEGVDELFGTPQYIAPEQLLGESGDNRSDIYSLGATLYHALTGKYPYTGRNAAEIARKHLTEPLTPPEEVVAEIPPHVSQLVQIMLAKRPEHRYQHAGELCADITRVRHGEQPQRSLSENSQKPYEDAIEDEQVIATAVSAAELEAESEAEVVAMPTKKKKLKISTVKISADEDEPAAVVATDEDEVTEKKPKLTVRVPDNLDAAKTRSPGGTQAAKMAQQANKKKVIMAVTGAAILVIAIAVVAVALLRDKNDDIVTAGGTASMPPASAEEKKEYGQIISLVRQNAAPETVLARADQFLREHGSSTLVANLQRAVAPALESEIRTLRAEQHEQELSEWQQQAAKVQEDEQQAAKERRQQELARQERYRQEALERREAAARQQQLAEMAETQQEIRWKAIELCRQHQYNEAYMFFVPMAQAREQEFQAWAKMKQQMLAYAEKTYNMVYNSKDKLKGVKWSMPGKAGRSRVDFIGRRHVEIVHTEVDYVNGEMVEKIKGSDRIPLTEITAPQMWLLCKESWEKDSGDPAELNLYFGAYLLSRGNFLQEAGRKLQASGRTEEIEPMLAELAIVEELVRERQWNLAMERLLLFVNQGDINGAKRLILYLRQNYPQKFAENEKRILNMIQEQ